MDPGKRKGFGEGSPLPLWPFFNYCLLEIQRSGAHLLPLSIYSGKLPFPLLVLPGFPFP